jgi:6-phosphofructokinase
MNEQNQNTKVNSLKQEIQDMKKEINIMSIREGVIRNQVENERAKLKQPIKAKKASGKGSFRAKKIHIEGQSLNSSQLIIGLQ